MIWRKVGLFLFFWSEQYIYRGGSNVQYIAVLYIYNSIVSHGYLL